MKAIVLAGALLTLLTAACTTVTVPRGTIALQPAQCEPTDQDAYVYSPDRLEVLSPCIRVSGTIKSTISNPFDGDTALALEPDESFQQYLTATNRAALGGTLHVEVICQGFILPMNLRAHTSCANNPDPLQIALPRSGDHVWAEGRWVLDHSHGGWAELHPLYRWSPFK